MIRDGTRRQRQSQLRKSRTDADQRVGKPGVDVGAGSSTDNGFRGSSPDAADLGALKAQIVHQPLRVKNEGNDGAGDGVGVDGAAGSDRDQYD